MGTETDTRPKASGHLIWTLGALSMFGPLSSDMYLPGLPSLMRSLHAGASTANLTLTASVLGIALGQLLAGPVSDSHGRRLPLLVGMVGFTVASALCAISPTIWMLVVVRFLQGLSGGAGIVIARAVVRDLYSGVVAARMFATLVIISGIAPIFAPLIGGQVLALSDWRGIFVVLTAIGLVLFCVALLRVPETLAPDRRHRGGLSATVGVFGRLLRDREFMPFAVSYAFGFGAMFAYISGGSYVLEDVYKISAQAFSAVFAANSVGLAVVSRVSSRFVGRVGTRRLLRTGLLIDTVAAGAVVTFCFAHIGIWPFMAGLFVLVASQGLILPNGMAAAMASQPDALGSASGLIGLGQFGLGAVLAPLVGIAGQANPRPMGVVMILCAAIALATNLVFVRRRGSAGSPASGPATPRSAVG